MDTDKGNVIQLPVITRLDLNADLTLKNLAGKLDGFVLAGYDKDGIDLLPALKDGDS